MAQATNDDQYDQYNDSKNDFQNNQAEETFDTNWKDTVESFEDMGLKEELLRGIYGNGFEKPSAIQSRGIIPVIKS